jgi:hypothetical protein
VRGAAHPRGGQAPRRGRGVLREGDTDPRNYRVSFDKVASQLGFPCDHTVQDYLARLVPAVQAGIYPDVTGNGRHGN